MKWIEAKVLFAYADSHLAVELITDAFSSLGVSGVVVEDPDDEPDEGWGEEPIFRPEHHAVIGFFRENDLSPGQCRNLEILLKGMEENTGIRSRVVYNSIDEQDWAESWKAFFWPEKISRTLVVKPTWRQYQAAPGEIVLEIDPGIAFGTGTHPTTRLCIRMLETHLRRGDSILDIGIGSGILLIAAAKLNAGRLYGIDLDPLAVDIARQNLLLNGIEGDMFTLGTDALVDLNAPPFDLIVANILSEVIIDLADAVPAALSPNGIFICSGIIEKNRDSVAAKLVQIGFCIFDERSSEKWVAMAARRR